MKAFALKYEPNEKNLNMTNIYSRFYRFTSNSKIINRFLLGGIGKGWIFFGGN